MRKAVSRIVDFSGAHPLVVLLATALIIAGSVFFALKLEVHPEFQELLPKDSPSYQAFEQQLSRLGGRASIDVIAESPDREANRRYIDAFADAILKQKADDQKACPPDKGDCGLILYVERGTKELRKYFQDQKFLYADLEDLKKAEREVDHQVAIRSDMVTDLLDDDPPPAPTTTSPRPNAQPKPDKKPALGLDEYKDKWEKKAQEREEYKQFPNGYFETEDGRMAAMRIISRSSGFGDAAGDTLLDRVRKLTAELDPTKFHPEMHVGLAGDVPNAVAEKESIVSDAVLAFAIALVLLIAGIVVFFRSPWSIIVIALPAFVGVGFAFAFAQIRFGYVNAAGAFLGAIILGNGINYPIVLLSRYREFRARGQAPAEARRDAVWNAFRAELVGACVGAIAYGSLTITQFRGFSQFGLIGFVGMLLVWVSMIPLVPALLVCIEWIQTKLPTWLRDPDPRVRADGSRGPLTRAIAAATERRPWLFIVGALVVSGVAVYGAFFHRGPSDSAPADRHPFLQDPWEYNFDKLGSRGSKHGGAGEWSNKAEQIFGKINITGAQILADEPDEVPLIKAKILENDAHDAKGRLVKDIVTVHDFLPGTPEAQAEKLKVLELIRGHLSERVLYDLPPDERKRVEELKPPETLHVLEPEDLPSLLRARFEEKSGRLGTLFYVKYWDFTHDQPPSFSDGHTLLRMAQTTDRLTIQDPHDRTKTRRVETASRATVISEIIRSMERDGPLATGASFVAVMIVVLIATHNLRGSFAVLVVLVMGVLWLVGGASLADVRLNFFNFIALPITFGIGCEYPFNVYDRSRLLGGDVTSAVKRVGGAVALCSYTTVVGYSSMLFSDQQALQSFGRLAMSGEIACLTGALLVLPALLHVLGRKAHAAPSASEATSEGS